MANDALLEISKLSKVFVSNEVETHALSQISLSIDRGEFVAITGPSGCGKSTLLSVLGLVELATSGSYRLDSRDVTHLNLTQRARVRNEVIGFVFQNFNLIGDISVLDNVALPLLYRGVSMRQRRRLASDALEKVEMTHRSRHFPSQLSGGQQQRVAIARALVAEPAVLLADEPTGNLDSANSDAVMKLISDVHEAGTTVCMVTHEEHYLTVVDRTIQLVDGRIVTPANST